MRWKKESEPGPNNKWRVVTKFLLFPKRIGDEVRWLERVSILQEAKLYLPFGAPPWAGEDWGWFDFQWKDD